MGILCSVILMINNNVFEACNMNIYYVMLIIYTIKNILKKNKH